MAKRVRRCRKVTVTGKGCTGSRLCSCPACRLQILVEAWSSSSMLSVCHRDRYDCSLNMLCLHLLRSAKSTPVLHLPRCMGLQSLEVAPLYAS